MCDVRWAFLWTQKNFVVLLITMFESISLSLYSCVCFASCSESSDLQSVRNAMWVFCRENKQKSRFFYFSFAHSSRYHCVSVYENHKMKWTNKKLVQKQFLIYVFCCVGRRKSFAVCCVAACRALCFNFLRCFCWASCTRCTYTHTHNTDVSGECEANVRRDEARILHLQRNDAPCRTRQLYYAVTHVMASMCFSRSHGIFPRFMEITKILRKGSSSTQRWERVLWNSFVQFPIMHESATNFGKLRPSIYPKMDHLPFLFTSEQMK